MTPRELIQLLMTALGETMPDRGCRHDNAIEVIRCKRCQALRAGRAYLDGDEGVTAQWMLDTIRASLREYPNCGGDIEINKSVKALLDARAKNVAGDMASWADALGSNPCNTVKGFAAWIRRSYHYSGPAITDWNARDTIVPAAPKVEPTDPREPIAGYEFVICCEHECKVPATFAASAAGQLKFYCEKHGRKRGLSRGIPERREGFQLQPGALNDTVTIIVGGIPRGEAPAMHPAEHEFKCTACGSPLEDGTMCATCVPVNCTAIVVYEKSKTYRDYSVSRNNVK